MGGIQDYGRYEELEFFDAFHHFKNPDKYYENLGQVDDDYQ